MTNDDYKLKIGILIQETRQSRGMTQTQLANALNTSQSAINRIEKGGQNISLEMLARISDVLSRELVTLNQSGKINFRINGGKELSGEIEIKTSKVDPIKDKEKEKGHGHQSRKVRCLFFSN